MSNVESDRCFVCLVGVLDAVVLCMTREFVGKMEKVASRVEPRYAVGFSCMMFITRGVDMRNTERIIRKIWGNLGLYQVCTRIFENERKQMRIFIKSTIVRLLVDVFTSTLVFYTGRQEFASAVNNHRSSKEYYKDD